MRSSGRSRSKTRVGPLVASPDGAPDLDVDALLADRSVGIIVCCGSGGVGKTTTSAALALRAAEQGRDAVVLTIDPARRLAQSMGIEKLDNVPRPVPGVPGPGSLDAMMLDMKRTFDEVVESQASPEKAAQILSNPFYVTRSPSRPAATTSSWWTPRRPGRRWTSSTRRSGSRASWTAGSSGCCSRRRRVRRG
jgi:Mrp family chromosome partitioning ATPase